MALYDRVLAFAVTTGQMAIVFVSRGRLKDWQMWRDTTADPSATRSRLRVEIATFKPTLIISEDPDRDCRKLGKSLILLRTLVQAVEDEPIRCFKVVRPRRYKNRYDEAKALADRFPEISAWCPEPRKSYQKDAKSLTYFEALAYVAEVLDAAED